MEAENKFLPRKNATPTYDWEKYCSDTENDPPGRLLVKALEHVGNLDSALDLGSGALVECSYLLEHGFKMVTAVDIAPVAVDKANKLPSANFQYKISSFEELEFPENSYDLISAQLSLPFIAPSEFNRVFSNISNALKNGGVFTGQFFGDRHAWSNEPGMTFHTSEEAEKLLSGFEELYFKEIEKSNELADGTELHWHLLSFIVRKI